MEQTARFIFNTKEKLVATSLIVIGIAAIIYGFLNDAHRTWANVLLGNFYFMAIALAGTFFIAVNYLAQAGWAVAFKRIPEAMGQHLIFAGIFMLLIFLIGGHDLYHWTHEYLYDPADSRYDPILAGKSSFLNTTFFLIRLILYFVIWYGFTYFLRRESKLEDLNGGLKHYNRSVTLSAIFIVLFGITSSTSSWDFLMSLDPHWYSTLFGWYTFAGTFVSGILTIILLLIYVKSRGYLQDVNENHFHDLGKFLFAFSIFWTYLWFSQFMLIWYANIPEETAFYLKRMVHYRPFFAANLIINFLFPLLILMTRDAKRKIKLLIIVCSLLFIGHWIDFYLIVMPSVVGAQWKIGFIEIGSTMFFAGIFLYVFFHSLSRAAISPQNHPMLQESVHHHI